MVVMAAGAMAVPAPMAPVVVPGIVMLVMVLTTRPMIMVGMIVVVIVVVVRVRHRPYVSPRGRGINAPFGPPGPRRGG